MDYTKATKADLLEAITKLEIEKTNAESLALNNAKIANWLQQVLEAIEKILIDSPFVNQEGKFFKKLIWVLSNFSAIRAFIEQIAAQIKQWREDVNRLKAQAQNATTNGN